MWGQTRLTRAGLKGLASASVDPAIPDAVAAAAQWAAMCHMQTPALQHCPWTGGPSATWQARTTTDVSLAMKTPVPPMCFENASFPAPGDLGEVGRRKGICVFDRGP
jgi:hypothetical protein